MSTELAKFDTTSLKEKVAERIRGTFVDLVPPEAWKALVEQEIKLFMDKPYSFNGDKVPPIVQIIRDELTARFKAMVKEELDDPKYSDVWYAGEGSRASDAVRDIVAGLVPELVVATYSRVVSDTIATMRSSLR